MNRALILVAILAIGGVAPVRAWCEATCLAPAAQGESHCPSHDPADTTTTVSPAGVDECPALESARPTAPARIDPGAALVAGYVPAEAVGTWATTTFARQTSAATVFTRCIPLRI